MTMRTLLRLLFRLVSTQRECYGGQVRMIPLPPLMHHADDVAGAILHILEGPKRLDGAIFARNIRFA
jgi:hypothetical protein